MTNGPCERHRAPIAIGTSTSYSRLIWWPDTGTAIWHTGLLLEGSGSTLDHIGEGALVLYRFTSRNLDGADQPISSHLEALGPASREDRGSLRSWTSTTTVARSPQRPAGRDGPLSQPHVTTTRAAARFGRRRAAALMSPSTWECTIGAAPVYLTRLVRRCGAGPPSRPWACSVNPLRTQLAAPPAAVLELRHRGRFRADGSIGGIVAGSRIDLSLQLP
jgi:hypothetical protein